MTSTVLIILFYLRSYQAHHTPVYNIQWNTFLTDVFISCAAEWNIKIWDIHNSYPLYTFDVDYPAGDVAWAPYSRFVQDVPKK